jgi:hypothetical protein
VKKIMKKKMSKKIINRATNRKTSGPAKSAAKLGMTPISVTRVKPMAILPGGVQSWEA